MTRKLRDQKTRLLTKFISIICVSVWPQFKITFLFICVYFSSEWWNIQAYNILKMLLTFGKMLTISTKLIVPGKWRLHPSSVIGIVPS